MSKWKIYSVNGRERMEEYGGRTVRRWGKWRVGGVEGGGGGGDAMRKSYVCLLRRARPIGNSPASVVAQDCHLY